MRYGRAAVQIPERDPLCSPCFMHDDILLTSDIDNADQKSTTNDVHHICRQKGKNDSIPWPPGDEMRTDGTFHVVVGTLKISFS